MIAVANAFQSVKRKNLSVFFAIYLLTFGWSVIARSADNNTPNPLDWDRVQGLRKTLGRMCSISFQNGNLRSIVESLEKEYSIRIWLDANIDLDVLSEFTSSRKTLNEGLNALAATRKAVPIWIGDTIYFSPIEDADALESAYWRIFRGWPKTRLAADQFEWPTAATPRDLLEAWAKKNQWKFEGLDIIEHDLWKAASLSAGRAPDQLACLLLGLKLEAIVDGPSNLVRLVPIRNKESFSYAYPSEKIDRKLLVDWRKHWPTATIKVSGKFQVVNASPAAHRELVAFPLIPKIINNTGDPLAQERFTLQFAGRLLPVLDALRNGPQITFDPWPLPLNVQDRPVAVNFKGDSIDDVLAELGKQANLKFSRNGLNVEVK